jgi:nickel-dependent lactate racemase
MRIQLACGLRELELELADDCPVLPAQGQLPPDLADPAGAVRAALESPHNFPALRRALTPDDHVAIVLDEQLPQPARLLVPVIEHILSARVPLESITLVCPPSSHKQEWIDELPDEFCDIHLEVHAPHDRRQLSYLATMKSGRRLYLNRTVVDADQAIVVSGRVVRSRLGNAGAPGMLFPQLSDEETRRDWLEGDRPPTLAGKGLRHEARQAVWLLGAPFFVHVVEGAGDGVAQVLSGLVESSDEAERLTAQRWGVADREPVRTVLATVSGTPSRHHFVDLANAARAAARFVEPRGRIVLLSEAAPPLNEAVELLRKADTPEGGLDLLRRQKPAGRAEAHDWASAADHAHIYLLSGLPDETVEELYATPLENPRQAQRLLEKERSCLVLLDAHKVQGTAEE